MQEYCLKVTIYPI